MDTPDSLTNRPTNCYLDELMNELQVMTNTYKSNHSVKFRNAQNLLIREIQRVWDAEMLLNSIGPNQHVSYSSTGNCRVSAGRDFEPPSMESFKIGNLLRDDLLKTPPPASAISCLDRTQGFSPMAISMINSLESNTPEKNEKENEEKFEKCDKLFFHPVASRSNPVGRLIGPRGMTIRQLEKDFQCKLHIRGKGCTRDEVKEERLRGRPGWEHLSEPLHVLITIRAESEKMATDQISDIKTRLQEFLEHPDSELKRAQLMQLAVIEGTLH